MIFSPTRRVESLTLGPARKVSPEDSEIVRFTLSMASIRPVATFRPASATEDAAMVVAMAKTIEYRRGNGR
jgi:hypothetical protein